MSLITFQEALQIADPNKHLLIGNGFSIDWKKDIFKYDALFDRADFSSLEIDSKILFDTLETRDFEVAIDALRKASTLARLYSAENPSLSERLFEDARLLKNILAQTIAKNHPDQPSEILESEYQHCRQFLSNFKHIYTLNYDLLLYWVLMHVEAGGSIKSDDGFRNSEDDSAGYVVWDNVKAYDQNIHYFHGALHLFDAGAEIKKFTWAKTGIKLIDQVREALDYGLFPLIVTEGSSQDKKTRIMHSGYLSRTIRSFIPISGSLFIHGHSLADNDDHIISMIPETNINKLFISLMSEPDAPENEKKLLKIRSLIERRKKMLKKMNLRSKKTELEIHFYKASTANLWRTNA